MSFSHRLLASHHSKRTSAWQRCSTRSEQHDGDGGGGREERTPLSPAGRHACLLLLLRRPWRSAQRPALLRVKQRPPAVGVTCLAWACVCAAVHACSVNGGESGGLRVPPLNGTTTTVGAVANAHSTT